MPARTKADQELTALLGKLYVIQEDLGAKPSEEEQKKKIEATKMGKGKKAEKTGTRFMELKSCIVDRLKTVNQLLQEQADRESGKTSVAAGNNPKEVIAAQNQMREEVRLMETEWEDLNGLYKSEARKKRSKFTAQELVIQQTLVTKLKEEIETVKTAQSKGFARGAASEAVANFNVKTLDQLDTIDIYRNDGPGFDPNSGGGAALTDGQAQQLAQIDARDQHFDDQMDVLGEGIDVLGDIARQQGEEVKKQGALLNNIGNRVDNLNEKVDNVNSKMKETLEEVGRSSGKLCVDIMCIVLAIGFASVFYKIAKDNGAI